MRLQLDPASTGAGINGPGEAGQTAATGNSHVSTRSASGSGGDSIQLSGASQVLNRLSADRAARMAELESVPAVVRPHDDAGSLELAVIENMAREDLNPVEEARACAALVEELGLTREEVGLLYLLFGNVAPYFRGMLGKKRGGTFEVSNTGRVYMNSQCSDALLRLNGSASSTLGSSISPNFPCGAMISANVL